MSGGHFFYIQDKIEEAACEIDQLVASNDDDTRDEYGYRNGRHYVPAVIARFRVAARVVRLAAAMVRRVDWLVSCDDGEDSFLTRWDEDCDPIYRGGFMKAILEFNFSEADGLDNDADVLLCLKARAMHRLLQDLQEYVEGRLQGAGAGGTNALQELEALRGWLVEEIQDNEIPGL